MVITASRKVDADTLFFNRRLTIEGDTELGLAIKNLIDSLDMDDIPSAASWLITQAGQTAVAIL